jgi:hypothetical protein
MQAARDEAVSFCLGDFGADLCNSLLLRCKLPQLRGVVGPLCLELLLRALKDASECGSVGSRLGELRAKGRDQLEHRF